MVLLPPLLFLPSERGQSNVIVRLVWGRSRCAHGWIVPAPYLAKVVGPHPARNSSSKPRQRLSKTPTLTCCQLLGISPLQQPSIECSCTIASRTSRFIVSRQHVPNGRDQVVRRKLFAEFDVVLASRPVQAPVIQALLQNRRDVNLRRWALLLRTDHDGLVVGQRDSSEGVTLVQSWPPTELARGALRHDVGELDPAHIIIVRPWRQRQGMLNDDPPHMYGTLIVLEAAWLNSSSFARSIVVWRAARSTATNVEAGKQSAHANNAAALHKCDDARIYWRAQNRHKSAARKYSSTVQNVP